MSTPDTNDRSDARRRAWRALITTSVAVLARLDDELRDGAAMSIAEYDGLLHTAEAGEAGIRMSALAERVLLTRAGLTSLVDRLEGQALVARVPDPDDRRATRVVLTDDGWARFRAAAELHGAGINAYFTTHLDEAEAAVVETVLGRVHDALTRPSDDEMTTPDR